jgi:hypothetical protein
VPRKQLKKPKKTEPKTMKTHKNITAAAIKSHSDNISRADFLKSLEPSERNIGALQFDRYSDLKSEEQKIISETQITNECINITKISRLVDFFKNNPSKYGDSTLLKIFNGRIMSSGQKWEADCALAYAENVTENDLKAVRPQALENLSFEKKILKIKLMLPAE